MTIFLILTICWCQRLTYNLCYAIGFSGFYKQTIGLHKSRNQRSSSICQAINLVPIYAMRLRYVEQLF